MALRLELLLVLHLLDFVLQSEHGRLRDDSELVLVMSLRGALLLVYDCFKLLFLPLQSEDLLVLFLHVPKHLPLQVPLHLELLLNLSHLVLDFFGAALNLLLDLVLGVEDHILLLAHLGLALGI